MSDKPLVQVRNLKKYFPTRKGNVHAVDDITLDIAKGETLGLVGESGCGKSTTGRAIIRLLEPTSGEVIFNDENILALNRKEMKDRRREMQMVFQDPYSCLNPRLSVAELISEPLDVNGNGMSTEKRLDRVLELMDIVGLAERLAGSYPHELDGGRRQRVGVARALALNPRFLVLDEPVSALDVCIQAQVLNLLDKLQKEMGLTYLFISHDLSVVHHVSDRIAVMYLGKNRRDGRLPDHLQIAQARLYQGPALGHHHCQAHAGQKAHHSGRRRTQSDQSAQGVPLCRALFL